MSPREPNPVDVFCLLVCRLNKVMFVGVLCTEEKQQQPQPPARKTTLDYPCTNTGTHVFSQNNGALHRRRAATFFLELETNTVADGDCSFRCGKIQG